MTDIKDYKINISADVIEDLQARLKLTRFPDKETPDDWSQGIVLVSVIRDPTSIIRPTCPSVFD